MKKTPISAAEIRRICGDIADWKIAAIQATGGDIDMLEQAVAWSAGDDETSSLRHLPPESAAGRIYDILIAGEEDEDDARR